MRLQIALLLSLLCQVVLAGFGDSRDSSYNLTAPGLASCTQSATYLAAVSGLSLTQISAYNTAICSLVSSGLFDTVFDGVYFMANASDANAKVNAVNPGTYNFTEHGTCTFTVNNSLTGNGTDCYLDTSFIPSSAGGHFARDSASIIFCLLNSRTTALAVQFDAGVIATHNAYFGPVALTNLYGASMNNGSQAAVVQALNVQGMWTITRNDPTFYNIFSQGDTALIGSSLVNSTGLPTSSIFALALNNGGPVQFATDQMAYFFYGSGLGGTTTAPQLNTIRTIMNTMLSTLGAPNVC